MSKKDEVLKVVSELCEIHNSAKVKQGQLPDLELWPKTRDISDKCDSSIYVTRSLLLQLVEEGKIIKSPQLYSNSLRWFIKVPR
ncbi:FaeA-like protein [Rosenbergiella nectarea]|uniref:FaeA-like protein n=1 Tax=Rosenbergiella nectarea TaxID=988801 RepID=A0A1H9FDJ9_9GAMM|nr:FaeA/PapI family transcriptional regulator [Rosenbergiella nectarea]SEQ36010.1 FaeA-like protein [Rosenbergiella nectarea]